MLPPPIGGWNKRDTLPLMDPKDALRLDNLIPDTTSVHLRSGFAVHATIAATATVIETLIQYSPPTTASNKLFAATPTIVYDVTAATTTSASANMITGLSNGRWQHAQMTNTAGSFLVMVNGADQPRQYNGTAFSTCSVSAAGLTRSDLVGVHNHMNRLWFIESNKNHIWYGATSAVEGTLTKFQLPFRQGGHILAMGSLTRDGGSGSDDYAVFVSSKGECIIYSGTDPTSSTTSALVGIYNIPEPIGRRCLINAGSDLGVLTSQGLLPLSQILGMTTGAAARSSFTDKISGQFRDQYRTTGTLFGWQCIEFPKENILIVNVPIVERQTQHQYVMNINTGAWCRFTDINAGCWSLLGDKIYFGGNGGIVYTYGSGVIPDGVTKITAVMQSAYSDMGTTRVKRFLRARPMFVAPSRPDPPVTVQVDYDDAIPTITPVVASTSGTQWDAGQWDTFQWAGGTLTSLRWQGVKGTGRACSIAFGVSSAEPIVYNGVDIGFEVGNWL